MRIKLIIFFLFSLCLELAAQSNQFLSLNLKRGNNTKRIKFYLQDEICFKIPHSKKKITGIITSLSDSGLVLDSQRYIAYKNIKKILIDLSNHLTHAASTFISGCGLGYIGLDALNNAINANSPVFKLQTLEIGAGLVLGGQIIRICSTKRYKMNRRHSLKFIDDTP